MPINKMDINKVRKPTGERKIIRMNIRTTPKVSKWMKDNEISPQLVFDEAINELMEKADRSKKNE